MIIIIDSSNSFPWNNEQKKIHVTTVMIIVYINMLICISYYCYL